MQFSSTASINNLFTTSIVASWDALKSNSLRNRDEKKHCSALKKLLFSAMDETRARKLIPQVMCYIVEVSSEYCEKTEVVINCTQVEDDYYPDILVKEIIFE